MKRHPLGKTGLTVTEVAFGAAPLGDMPDTYGHGVDEATARATIHAMMDGPSNVLDTSRNYGMGRSEARIGAVIRERGGLPAGFVLCTKLDRDMQTGKFDASQARRSFETSLETLGVDHVQILHLHDPEHAANLDEITRRGGAIDELFRIRDEGLATAVGLAMGRLDIMLPLVREHPFDLVLTHNRYTLLNRSADTLLDEASARGMVVFNAAPYSGGVLAKGSERSARITYQEADEEMLSPVRRIEAVCARHGVPMGAAALQWSVRDPRISSTVIGVSKPERLAETMDWAALSIQDEVWSDLQRLSYSEEDPEADRDYLPS